MLATIPARPISKLNGQRSALRGRNAKPSAMVMVNGRTYLVDLGLRYSLRFHTVRKDKTCSCGIAHCQAVSAVEAYLKGGGQRASEQSPSSQQPPPSCPICGAPIAAEGTGWRCTADRSHYHLYRTQCLRARREDHLVHLSEDERRYWAEVLSAFEPTERAKFLTAHALTYPAGS